MPAGVALLAVMAHPDVDPTRTVSNHLIEIIDVLGIEAARNALMKVRISAPLHQFRECFWPDLWLLSAQLCPCSIRLSSARCLCCAGLFVIRCGLLAST